MSNEEIKRAILEMDEREELAKDMLEQVLKHFFKIFIHINICIQSTSCSDVKTHHSSWDCAYK